MRPGGRRFLFRLGRRGRRSGPRRRCRLGRRRGLCCSGFGSLPHRPTQREKLEPMRLNVLSCSGAPARVADCGGFNSARGQAHRRTRRRSPPRCRCSAGGDVGIARRVDVGPELGRQRSGRCRSGSLPSASRTSARRQLGEEGLVHAAVAAGAHRDRRRAALDQVGELRLVGPLLLGHRVAQLLVHLIGRAAAGRHRSAAACRSGCGSRRTRSACRTRRPWAPAASPRNGRCPA